MRFELLMTLSRYTQRQLYAMVADVDNYYRFIPFVSKSETVKHTGPRTGTEKPWLDDKGEPGEIHKLDHIMQIAALGFEEAWQSHVTCEKYSMVSVCASFREEGLA
jgi:ribosome-associated toxin RatA of RatAB toxin-antitoxin module